MGLFFYLLGANDYHIRTCRHKATLVLVGARIRLGEQHLLLRLCLNNRFYAYRLPSISSAHMEHYVIFSCSKISF